ncbi:dihydrofolate reductase family protein [Fulvivirgaceae bacterium PWU5]|uniref:Dihydrofolate reductase family protein n=1 Tax=Dawidia cretensis TaxID=2782350 RepID=A0AAP2GVV5_9BACT|nr:dihydrofolate reductase family protein [Dawidia cretensis]MBT1711418.1 dihydrofolate reductase family protein [Dawidia cretensis]
MRKLISVVHTSLDGFVAGENGDFDKLVQSPENLDFICSLTDKADALVAGRVSFEMLDSYWPTAHETPGVSDSAIRYSHWYNSAEKIVLSNTLREKKDDNVTIISEKIEDTFIRIKNKKGKDILLFGSPSVCQALMNLNLIEECWIIIYPVVLGKGIALFNSKERAVKLKCLGSTQFTMGEIAIHYKFEY